MTYNDVIKKLINQKETAYKDGYRFRWKKRTAAAMSRAVIVNILKDAGRPLNANEVAFKTGCAGVSTTREMKVLLAGKVICSEVTSLDQREVYYTICPVCPLKESCKTPLYIWKNVTVLGESE